MQRLYGEHFLREPDRTLGKLQRQRGEGSVVLDVPGEAGGCQGHRIGEMPELGRRRRRRVPRETWQARGTGRAER